MGTRFIGASGLTNGMIACMSHTSRNVAAAAAARCTGSVRGQFVRSMRIRRANARIAGVNAAHSQQLASAIRNRPPYGCALPAGCATYCSSDVVNATTVQATKYVAPRVMAVRRIENGALWAGVVKVLNRVSPEASRARYGPVPRPHRPG